MKTPTTEPDTGFASIQLRPALCDALPRPLAYTYDRLMEEIQRREPIAAAWALRDAWDCAIRLTACLGLADLVQAGAPAGKLGEAMAVLFKASGVSLGDWASLVSVGCDARIATEHPRLLSGLTRFHRDAKGLLTPTGKFLSQSAGPGDALGPGQTNVVNWRNKVMAHGVFRRDRAWYEGQTAQWVEPLHQYYDELLAVLDGWTLRDCGADGPTLTGTGHGGEAGAHQHVGEGGPETVVLAGPAGTLDFGPLLSAQRCLVCGERHIFFYDRSLRKKSGDVALRTELLDFLEGHGGQRQGWSPALAWEAHLPAARDHDWQRSHVSQKAVSEQTRSVFNRFEELYRRPDWIMDRLWEEILDLDRGYAHLESPAGTGKSYLARALKAHEGPDRGLPVLVYHIQPGLRADYRTFIMLLADEAKEQLDARTQEIQAKDQGAAGLRQQFKEFLAYLMGANGLERLLLVIDGLDELPDPAEPGDFAITDFLAPAGELPAGCVIVLTGRPQLRPGIAGRMEALASASGQGYRKVVLDTEDAANRAMLVAYAQATLPEAMGQRALAERIAERSRGVFLYAFHLIQALASGAFAPGEDLPAAEAFYQAYLDKLRKRVGDGLYEEVYRTLLLFLAASHAPVTIEQLKSWGLRADRLESALLDMADFIEEVRWRPWHGRIDDEDERPRYRIAHAEFIGFVEGDPALRPLLEAARTRIATVILHRHEGRWDQLDPESEEDAYDARAILEWIEQCWKGVIDDPTILVRPLTDFGAALWKRQRWVTSETILARCVQVLRKVMPQAGRWELDIDLATALNNQGLVLEDLNRLDEAESCQRESVAILRQLVEQDGQRELEDGLVRTLNNHGSVLQDLGRLGEAEACLRENVTICRRLVEQEGRRELDKDLATALNNHGLVLQVLTRLGEAEACQRENVTICRRLVEQEGRRELDKDLATALNNHGSVLQDFGRLGEAEACQRENVEIRRRLVEQDGRRELENYLASALNNHGLALQALTRLAEAEACQQENVTICRRLVEQEGRCELDNYLAEALLNYGSVLQVLTRLDEAESYQRECVDIRRRLVNQEGRRELDMDLAVALSKHGVVLKDLNRLDEAEACQRQSVTILRRLVKLEGRRELERHLAIALNNQGSVLQALGRFDEAEAYQRDSVDILRRMVEQEGRREVEIHLAAGLSFHGSVLRALTRLNEAEACQREGVAILRRMVEQEGWRELENNLATEIENLGHVLREMKRLSEAEPILRQVPRVHEECVTNGHQAACLDWIRSLAELGKVRFALGWLESAELALSNAVSIPERHPQCGDQPYTRDWLISALDTLANVRALRKDWAGVVDAIERIDRSWGATEPPLAWRLKRIDLRGLALEGMGELAAALRAFEAGIDLATAEAGHDPGLAGWREVFLFRRAGALVSLSDPGADEAVSQTIEIWRGAWINTPNETSASFLARSLNLYARHMLSCGDASNAMTAAVEASTLLTPLIHEHWRYREPLAESLRLLAEANERLGNGERVVGLRAEAEALLIPPEGPKEG